MTMERRKPTTEAGRGLLIAMDDGTADMESMLLYAILAVEQQAAAAAIRRADALREAALDVERLTKALDNLWERRWGPLPMPKGQTTLNLENASAIAAEYAALSAGEPAE